MFPSIGIPLLKQTNVRTGAIERICIHISVQQYGSCVGGTNGKGKANVQYRRYVIKQIKYWNAQYSLSVRNMTIGSGI